jgi:hypothetical protein
MGKQLGACNPLDAHARITKGGLLMTPMPLKLDQVMIADVVWIELVKEGEAFSALLDKSHCMYNTYKRVGKRKIDLLYMDYGSKWLAWRYELPKEE